jgi:hypothetical protein
MRKNQILVITIPKKKKTAKTIAPLAKPAVRIRFSVVLNNFDNKLKTLVFTINNPFSYYSQSPLARSFNIWQPPKLG